ncbi:C_GCAxxG_C_C family probable redox protein [Clostridium algifaecis]|uniref:C_GCAxxG_C_C family probable redox protein n=1 Tax=Clostridium algifaecis TaxID=1472040 RepID=A0ABS4KVK9_9CLOT|nr:C-GCAxxG-C-C family protein [Clostridium algifaecis]MBP2034043.1 C_GCAxxG_C_C family probable redox protein [Clostridium algifaecis]
MKNRIENSVELYEKGYNCSQAILCSYNELLGIDEVTAFRLSEGFGGGMGMMQGTCGAVTAMFAVLSYFNSDGLLEKGKSKLDNYKEIRRSADLFIKEYGSINCKEILQGNTPKALQCGEKVRDAAKIIEQLLESNFNIETVENRENY